MRSAIRAAGCGTALRGYAAPAPQGQARGDHSGTLTDQPLPPNYRDTRDEMSLPLKDTSQVPNWGTGAAYGASRVRNLLPDKQPHLPRGWFDDDIAPERRRRDFVPQQPGSEDPPAPSSQTTQQGSSSEKPSTVFPAGQPHTQARGADAARPPPGSSPKKKQTQIARFTSDYRNGFFNGNEEALKAALEKVSVDPTLNEHDKTFLMQTASKLKLPLVAEDVLNTMEPAQLKTPKPFTLVMSGYAAVGDLSGVQRLWASMKKYGVSANLFTYNVVLRCFMELHDSKRAIQLLGNMEGDGVQPDLVSYNTTIRSCTCVDTALGLLRQAVDLGFSPDKYTLQALLAVCVYCSDAEAADLIVADMLAKGLAPELMAYDQLMQLHIKLGNDMQVLKLHQELEETGIRANETISAHIVDVCAKRITEPRGLFYEMLKVMSHTPLTTESRKKVKHLFQKFPQDDAESR